LIVVRGVLRVIDVPAALEERTGAQVRPSVPGTPV
jgi:hypothetical protein